MPQRSPYESWLPLTPRVFHILLALVERAEHGYGIMKEVESRSGGRVRIGPGTLYEAIHGLNGKELIVEVDSPPDADSRRRYYELTELGRDVLAAETERLSDLVAFARDRQGAGVANP